VDKQKRVVMLAVVCSKKDTNASQPRLANGPSVWVGPELSVWCRHCHFEFVIKIFPLVMVFKVIVLFVIGIDLPGQTTFTQWSTFDFHHLAGGVMPQLSSSFVSLLVKCGFQFQIDQRLLLVVMDCFKLFGCRDDGGQMLLVFTMRCKGRMTFGNGFLSNGFVFVSDGLFTLFALLCLFVGVVVHDRLIHWLSMSVQN